MQREQTAQYDKIIEEQRDQKFKAQKKNLPIS